MKYVAVVLSLVVVLMLSSTVLAQGYLAYMPVAPGPVVSYYAPAPAVSYGPVATTSYYAPAPYYAAAAPVPYYAAAPVPYYAAAPVMGGPVAFAPVYARPVIVRTKVYIPGEPVRNVLRAVTP
jgi:hypothetical protein